MAVKYIDSNILLTLIKVDSKYVIERRNVDFICTYVSVDQDDTSAKKPIPVFQKLTFLVGDKKPLKLVPHHKYKKDLMHQFISKYCVL